MEEKITAKGLKNSMTGKSASDVVKGFEAFLKDVEDNGYVIVPTISAFADFFGQPRADVHEWFRLHPIESKQMRDMCADTIAGGAMLKKYVPNVTNFALKNWCGWEEAPQKKSQTSKDVADEKKAKQKLDEYMANERVQLRLAK